MRVAITLICLRVMTLPFSHHSLWIYLVVAAFVAAPITPPRPTIATTSDSSNCSATATFVEQERAPFRFTLAQDVADEYNQGVLVRCTIAAS